MEGRPLEDAELTRQAKDGDVRAYEELVERYREVAFRTPYLIAGSAADAEDAAQDAFVKAYYALGRFRSGADFRPWILRIVANEARNRLRSARRREGLSLRLAEMARVLGVRPGTVKSRLARAPARLRGALPEGLGALMEAADG